MTAISSLPDEEIEQLLAGRTPHGRQDLAPVAEVTAALRERALDERVPIMRYPLRHALTRSTMAAPVRSRRRVHAALGGAAIAVVSLAGAANALPAPMQDAVAHVGDLVGVSVPRASDDDRLELPPSVARPAPTTVAETDGVGAAITDAPPPSETPGGAAPTDPGAAGDLEPATVTTPPAPSAEHAVVPNDNAAEGAGNASPGASATDDEQGTSNDPTDEGDDGDDGVPDDAGDAADERLDRRPITGTGR